MSRDRWTLFASLALLCCLGVAGDALARSGGAPGAHTGGPFPGERACTQCHAGAINSGQGSLALSIGGAPAAEHGYTPGETVSLVVEFSDASAVRSGFQLTVRSGDGCGQPGTLAAGSTANGSGVRTATGTCGSGTVQWATHSRPRNGPTGAWDVAWTAPSETAGPVTVAVTANGANGDAATSGDQVYTLVATIEPAAQAAPPVISENGVVLADLASSTATGAPRAIAAARGSGFAAMGVASEGGALDEAGRLSAALEGTCLEINQTRAPMVFLSEDLAGFQIPASTGIGSASVQVIRGCDTPEEARSNMAPFQVAAVQPAFFLFSESPPGIGAMHDDLSLVAPADSMAGRPARPGEVVTFFGTGFGPTEPPLETGEIATQPRALANASLRPMVGQMELAPENIVYAGAAPNFAGVYQLSVRVPDEAAPGSHAFSVLLDGVQSAAGPMLEIAEAEDSVCAVGLVVQPGGRCVSSAGEAGGGFEVDMAGQACFVAGEMSTCGDASLSAAGAEAMKNDDGSWTVTAVPDPVGEPMEEGETIACAVDLVVPQGGRCAATISGIMGTLVVDEEGMGCLEVASLGFPLCGENLINTTLSLFGAAVRANEDGTWTVTMLPAP